MATAFTVNDASNGAAVTVVGASVQKVTAPSVNGPATITFNGGTTLAVSQTRAAVEGLLNA